MKPVKKFVYQQRDASTVKQRANQRGTEFDSIYKEGVKLYKPKDGKNTIRILPPTWSPANHYGYDVYVNYGIGINEQAYLSLSEMRKERDPLAEARKKAERSGDKDLADSLKPSKRVGLFLIDRTDEDAGPQLWLSPWTIDRDFCNLAIDEDTGSSLMIDDPENGNDIRFYKEGSGLATKYPAAKMKILKATRLSEDDDKMDDWLTVITEMPLPDCLNYYDYDHIASVFDGYVRDDKKNAKKPQTEDSDDDEGAKPAKPKPTNGSAKPPGNGSTKPKVLVNQDPDDEYEYDAETGVVLEAKEPPFEVDGEQEEAKSSIAAIKARLAGRRAG